MHAWILHVFFQLSLGAVVTFKTTKDELRIQFANQISLSLRELPTTSVEDSSLAS